MQLLPVIVRGCLLDLLLDLCDAALDVLLRAGAVNDRRVLLLDPDALGFAQHVERHVLELNAEVFTDHLAAGQDSGCDLYLERQAVDTTTPAGRALFQMLGVFAEFERAIIAQHVRAGMARARLHGTKSGKPIGQPPLVASKVEAIRAELSKVSNGMQSGPRIGMQKGLTGIGTGLSR
jgi:hypothetical protein